MNRQAWVRLDTLRNQPTTGEGTTVQHPDGSIGVLLGKLLGVAAGPDLFGVWRIPVEWKGGPQAAQHHPQPGGTRR